MIELGAFIRALNQGWIADHFSRKYSIVLAVIVFIIGGTLQTLARDYAMLIVARLIGGVGIGMLSMVVPLYISEISPVEIRGSLLVLEEVSIVTGIILAFWFTYFTRYIPSEWSWRLPFLLQMVPAFILRTGILFLPFSPRWLVACGRDHEALETLSKLRQSKDTNQQVLQEWFEIRAEAHFNLEIGAKRYPDIQESGFLQAVRFEMVSFIDCFSKRMLEKDTGRHWIDVLSAGQYHKEQYLLRTKICCSSWGLMPCKSLLSWHYHYWLNYSTIDSANEWGMPSTVIVYNQFNTNNHLGRLHFLCGILLAILFLDLQLCSGDQR